MQFEKLFRRKIFGGFNKADVTYLFELFLYFKLFIPIKKMITKIARNKIKTRFVFLYKSKFFNFIIFP